MFQMQKIPPQDMIDLWHFIQRRRAVREETRETDFKGWSPRTCRPGFSAAGTGRDAQFRPQL